MQECSNPIQHEGKAGGLYMWLRMSPDFPRLRCVNWFVYWFVSYKSLIVATTGQYHDIALTTGQYISLAIVQYHTYTHWRCFDLRHR